MIIRIVKMEFEEAHIDDFLSIFAESKSRIRAFTGCSHLQLLQDESDTRVFFTYSHWDSTNSLNAYRQSGLFQSVWGNTKKLFRKAPEAWSVSDRTGALVNSH